MIDLELYYHLEREYLFMDTKEKTAEHWKLQARLILSDHMDYYESKGNSIIYMAEEDTLIKAMEAYAEQKLSALQADPEKRDAATYYKGCQDTFNHHVKPALAKQLELQSRIQSLEAENEELRKKNVHLDKEALHFRDLYEQGLTIIKELNQPLPSKPENK